MLSAALPLTEPKRLAALRDLGILDTPPERDLDDIVRIASEICRVPIALITLVDAHRQWFKARIGLDAAETSRDVAFCSHAILDEDIFVVHDASKDPRFSDNPLVTGGPTIRFYAGAPLSLPSGDRIGTLCVIDAVPRTFTQAMRDALLALKRQTETQLALRAQSRELRRANAALVLLQKQQQRMVQFVVHDMRNALGALQLNAECLVDQVGASHDARDAASDIVQSSRHLGRMVDDMLAVGLVQQGDCLHAEPQTLRIGSLFDELASTFATSLDEAKVSLQQEGADLELRADPYLLRRILENLVANALRFAPRGSTLRLCAERRGGVVRVSLSDDGPGVPESMLESIFDLYETTQNDRVKHGIGLAFCRAAVTAQGGRIWVEQKPEGGSRFCIELACPS